MDDVNECDFCGSEYVIADSDADNPEMYCSWQHEEEGQTQYT